MRPLSPWGGPYTASWRHTVLWDARPGELPSGSSQLPGGSGGNDGSWFVGGTAPVAIHMVVKVVVVVGQVVNAVTYVLWLFAV